MAARMARFGGNVGTMTSKPFIKSLWDFVGIPFRLALFDKAWLPRFGWTTLEEERIDPVLPHVRGRLLDIGSGPNRLVNTYGDGVGVDVNDWGGGTVVVQYSSKLPFDSASFDTVTLVACLNHIPYRQAVLREARRLLRPGGRLIITIISPLLGNIGHAIWWYSEDKKRGGMKQGEVEGMSTAEVRRLCEQAGFRLKVHCRFVCGINNLYVFERASEAEQGR